MLLNTWLATAKRHLLGSAPASGSRRSGPSRKKRVSSSEQLESRTLLTALVINTTNVDSFVDASGTLSVTNSDLGTHDTLVIEDVAINSTGDGISIDLSGITLTRLALESIDVNAFNGTAIDINLTNTVGTTRTIALEDISVNAGTGNGIDLTLDNSDAFAVTVEDSFLPGVSISAINNADITHGIVTENQIVAPANVTGVQLNVAGGASADDFQIINNREISALNRDAVLVNLVDAPVDGLNISNNVIGNEPGADVSFRAEGDTFIQPFELMNNASDSELLTQFVLDLRPLGLVFEANTYRAVNDANGNNTGVDTGAGAAVLSNDNQVLTIDFNTDVANPTFAPGDTLLFVVDVDDAPAVPGDPPVDLSVFGRDLIGALVNFSFGPGLTSGAKQVAGSMIGDADIFNAAVFARGAGTAANFHGINLNLTNSPLTNATVSNNMITRVAGHGVLVDAQQQSDVSAVIRGNEIVSGGQDGLRFDLLDSNFTGGVVDNTIGGNSGHGVNFQPSVSRTGLVEAAIDGSPVIITSTNHQLQTGDEIIVQGMVNDDPTVNHPGNGRHTVTRIDNNTFSLQGVSGLPASVVYVGGGSWYVPNIQVGGMARGLVEIDLQATEPQGRIQTIVNPGGGGDVQLTSLAHGLATGERVRVSGAVGTLISGTQVFQITVIDNDTFSLNGALSGGTYDTSGGLATWTTNVIEGASTTGEVVVTSVAHALATGDQIRVVNVSLIDDTVQAAANGTWTVTRLTDDTFSLQGSTANGAYRLGTGHWIPLAEATFTGDVLPQVVSGNAISSNGGAGFFVDLTTGTRFDGDLVFNTVSGNTAKGVHIVSHSFGLGTDLPLDPNDANAVPSVQDISFNVNIGTATTDGNRIENNVQAGIVVESLDFATGSFEIQGNRINANVDDNDPMTPYQGDGIVVRLASDLRNSEAIAFLSESIIADNQIGVDARGNQGNGLSFSMTDRTKIHDLEINSNFFLNSGLDGFHFVRSEDGDLNQVIFDDNDATNNAGDGFDLFAQNTVKDRLDFTIRNSRIDNNGEYGMRIEVQADARIDVDISGSSVRKNGISALTNGNGFNPADGAGAVGAAGGVGIHGFQQVDVNFNAVETNFSENFGDGFSVDAENFFDTLTVNASFVDSDLNGNTLTGFRSVGSAYGTYTWTRSDFVGNGTDGARIISNVDVNDFYDRRVGGQDIDVVALGNDFQLNGGSGLVLGMGVSASLGSGDVTENFANEFGGRLDADRADYGAVNSPAGNTEDGLKIVQEAGPYMRERALRRVIQTQGNFFTFNTGDGVDIGHFVAREGGNVLHGEEVISDTHVIITDAELSNNGGDGVEYLADNVFRVPAVPGGGQDFLPDPSISSLSVSRSDIKNNGQRGVDILNRYSEDSRVTLTENEIIGNGYSGAYVVNTSTHTQLQNGPNDPLDVFYWNGGGIPSRTPNIELRVQDNLIESNGTAAAQSTVPINDSVDGAANDSATANSDYHELTNLITGTLGGLVVRVGTTDTSGQIVVAAPEYELGLSGVDAEVWNNNFDGNFGADVYLDNFTSFVAPLSGDHFHDGDTPPYRWNRGFRDPLSRLDLVFRDNTGNSLDVINGFAFTDNNERVFKSRIANGTAFPEADGIFLDGARGGSVRRRNSTRTLGYLNVVGDVPSSQPAVTPAPGSAWSYDGWGTPTWRVESDFDFNNFDETGTVSGYSDFFDVVNLSQWFAEEDYQWDTGVNQPGFSGVTPYSLARGDVFDVQASEAPIVADSLDENDSFVGATRLLLNPLTDVQSRVSGAFSVNSLATNGNLNIDRKGDRDYYQFLAAGTGSLDVNLTATDTTGDSIDFLIYEVDPLESTSEVPMVVAANGVPIRTTVTAGNAGTITVNVVTGRSYIIEVMSDESSNLAFNATAGKSFNYGTVRSYTLSLVAPVGPVLVQAAAPPSAPVAPVTVSVSSPGVTAAVSIDGQDPFIQSITQVAPDPISTSINNLIVTFSEDVTGVDQTDFQLTRDGVVLDLFGVGGAILNPIDAVTYEVTNLTSLTGENGDYVFTFVVANSGVLDTDLESLGSVGSETESWTVNNSVTFLGDTIDNVPNDGNIADVDGNRSLRAGINETNANPGPDILTLSPGTYTLTLAGRFEDDGLTGDLDIRDDLTIRGTGATALDTVIDAAQLDRVFHVFPGVELILDNLTIQGGQVFDGAGIFVEGLATPTGITAASTGRVTMTDVNVIDNEAYNQGGGIYNLGVLDVSYSSISRNTAGSRGGGVFNHGSLNLINSTISTNTAVSRGGGVYNELLSSAVNSAIRPFAAYGSLNAVNSTIAFNHADAAGGGLYQETSRSIRIGNSIVDLNTAQTSADLFGTIDSLGYNFFGMLDGTPEQSLLLANDTAADSTAGVTVAGLNALSTSPHNGTWLHTLAPTAFAIDAGSRSVFTTELQIPDTDAAVIAEADQGNSALSPRLVEGNDDGIFAIDIGASEFFVSQPVAIIAATPNPAGQLENVSFSAAGSTHTLTPGTVRIVLYEWDFDYDNTTFNIDATGQAATHAYPALGAITVGLRVTDDTGATDIATVLINVSAPSAPVITSPLSAGTSDLTPTITWVSGTGTFDLVVTNLDTGLTVINEAGLTTTDFTPSTNLVPGNYQALVTATNASGSAQSAPHTFVVQRIALIDPLNFDIEFDTTPEFTFTAIPDADRYQVWVSQLDPDDRSVTIAFPINESFIDAQQALIFGTSQASWEPPNRLSEGYFRVWVRAFETNGNAGAWSAGSQFQITRPTVTGPEPGTRITIDDTPTITWTDVGANQYEIWLTQINGTMTDSGGNVVTLTSTQLVTNQIISQATEFTPVTELGNGDFRFWVRALDDDGEAGLWSDQYDFTKNRNQGPQLISPILGATTTDRTPIFEWQALAGATHYEIWVNNSNTQTPRIIHNTNVAHVEGATSIYYTDPSVVLRNATYRWWVRAFNEDNGAAAWSTSETFWVPTPVMTAPVGVVASTNLPTFTWTGVPEYVRYELWVNNDTTSQSRVVYEPNLTDVTFTTSLPLLNGSFRAWVRGHDVDGNASQWSNPISFAVNSTISNAPTALTPSGFTTDNTPLFSWTTLPNLTDYEIFVKNMLGTGQPTVINQLITPTIDATTGNATFTPTNNLIIGSYRWWIRGVNADGTPGPWSQPRDFRVVSADQPSILDDNSFDRETIVASLSNEQWSDDVVNITVHPAAVVAARLVEDDDDIVAVSSDNILFSDLDSVMDELATADWWDTPLIDAEEAVSLPNESGSPAVTSSVVSNDSVDQNDRRSASLLGLALASMTMKRRRKED
ncbi:MAG: hypothetical protein GY903_24490 [Fuerstiella sp.]|nr:hypothetical protein [Fuerstiella sp.]